MRADAFSQVVAEELRSPLIGATDVVPAKVRTMMLLQAWTYFA